jgi:hypothetical protein
VGYHGVVHPDVIVIIEIQEFFGPSAIVGDDGVRDPEAKNDVLDEIHCLHGANLRQGPCLDPLSELVDRDKQVGQAPERLLEGPRRSRPHTANNHVIGIV